MSLIPPMKCLPVLLGVLLLVRSGASGAEPLRLVLQHDDQLRAYRLYVPASYERQAAAPLLLVLHGRNGSGERMAELTGFDARAERHGFIAVYPDALDARWNYLHGVPGAAPGADDAGFLLALTAVISRKYHIDPGRRYVVGISNGGFMAQRLVCAAGSGFSGFASVAAGAYALLPQHCERVAPVDALYLHGTADRLVPWEGLEVRDQQGERQRVTLSISDSARFWSAHNRCAPTLSVAALEARENSPGTRVRIYVARGCAAAAEVSLYAILGGGHNWPGVSGVIASEIAGAVNLDIHASDVIWSFFTRPRAP